MSRPVSPHTSFAVTPGAVAKLLELKDVYGKRLKFRVFSENGIGLRVHDKEYLGDWTLSIGDVGIAMDRQVLGANHNLTLDCFETEANQSGFGLMLFDRGELITELDGDDVIARILSVEAEVCDAYGEFCYTEFVTPALA